MRRTTSWTLATPLTGGLLVLAGCILTPAGCQILQLSYKLSTTLAAGQESLVHLQV